VCGIVGQLLLADSARPIAPEVAARAMALLAHRGPDGHGQWRSADRRCWLGHTRLAVIDLATGSQPMLTADDRLAIAFNGEIYNFAALRDELSALGHRFRTRSDTEVILEGYRRWGGAGLVRRLQGIFAFALYDAAERALFLARDHAGVKPLFWWTDGKSLVFASEMKALMAFPEFQAARRVNESGIAQLIVTRMVSRPQTLLEGVHRLPEGSTLRIVPGRPIEAARTYWDWRPAPRDMSLDEAALELEQRLEAVVAQQLVADVPVGVQLSGGVDSSLVAAMMDTVRRKRGDANPVKSFSIGFDIPEFSELHHAAKVAARYATDHHEIVIGAEDFVRDFARLCWYYDEPMGEPSAIPTYYMCRSAREQVTVMLCGEGADERFGGYNKYSFEALAARLAFMPSRWRSKALRTLAGGLPFRARRLRSILEIAAIASEPLRFASWYGALDAAQGADLLSERYRQRHGDGGLRSTFETILDGCPSDDVLARFCYADGHSRLVDNLLVKCDRMSMAAGIEARVPFLDHTLAEFSASMPSRLKIRGADHKHVLKKVAEKYLPHEVIYRRKVGFTVPLTRWFVGPLAPMLRGVLLSEQALDRGYFDANKLRALVDGHVNRDVDREQALWVLLTLEIWHRLFIDGDGSEDAIARVGDQLLLLPRGSAVPARKVLAPSLAGSARRAHR
jgi:asparagine synthase (glutamine-hydrolysing)